MISVKHRGNFSKTEKFLNRAKSLNIAIILNSFGQKGVDALSAATPLDTGETARSWYYKIEQRKGSAKLIWFNTNSENGVPVVILIQYGHGTQNGSYVPGRDFINPALKPILDELSNAIYEEVSKL